MKNKRLAILLALMVVLPLALLGWFAHSSLEGRNAEIRAQFQALLQERTRQAALVINAAVESATQGMHTRLSTCQIPSDMYQAARQDPLAVHGFWLDSTGRLVFPDSASFPGTAEQAFLDRTRTLWNGNARIDMSGGEEVSASQSRRPAGDNRNASALSTLAHQRDKGWIPWFWEDGLHLLYWSRGPQNSVHGFEVDRTALLARIIGALPESDPGQGAFVLRDENARLLHRYGGYRIPEKATPLTSLPLEAPLQGWSIAYYGPADDWESSFTRTERMNLLLKFSVLGAILALLAFVFLRESTRSLRDAHDKVNFVNQVSHELKTPLTNIRLYAELLEDELENPEHRHKLQVISNESERLSRMILNILTFSRRERKKLQLHPVAFPILEKIQESLEQFAPGMAKRGLQVVVDGEAPRPVRLDPDASRQILANLLGNVEKYALAGQRLHIRIVQTEQETRVEMQDYGPGIAWEFRDKIFQPFFRIHDHTTEGVSGTGIGLDIARTLARLMGGDLVLAPSAQGALFIWRIPA